MFWARTAAGGFVISSHLASLVDRPDVADTIDYESVLLNSMMGLHSEQILPRARADGVRTMLSGWGGDELASFNRRNVVWSLARRGRVDAVWSNVTGRLAIHSTDPVPLRKKIRAVGGHLFMATPGLIHNLRRPADAGRSRAEEAEIDSILREVSPLAADIRRERNRTFAQARDHHEYQIELLTGGHIQHRP